MAIITIKITYFESSYFHLLNDHAGTDEYLADHFSMAHLLAFSLTSPFFPSFALTAITH